MRPRQKPEEFIVEEIDENNIIVTDYVYGIQRLEKKTNPSINIYAVYVLCKRNISTLRALKILEATLRIPMHYITVAGLKDTKAFSCQLIHVNTAYKRCVPGIIYSRDITAYLIGFSNKPLTKGAIWGNKFTITLTIHEEDLPKLLNNVKNLDKERILPAYYGYQRFGTRRPITHVLGKYIAKREWCSVIKSIINIPFVTENNEIIKWRLHALHHGENAKVPKKLDIEKTVYQLLHKEKDKHCYNIIIHSIPRGLIELFLSAYQSYLFNRILSLKIEDHTYNYLDVNSGIAVPGYRLRKCDEHCKYVLEEENVTSKNFYARELGIKAFSYRRSAKMYVYDLCIREHKLDNNHDITRIVLSFKLRKGMYATIVLREITRANPLILS